MTQTHAEIMKTMRAFILREFLPGEDEAELTPDTPLITSKILDSISTIQLVTFLEETYGIEFQAHEITEDHLDNLTSAASLIVQKLGG